MAPKVFSSSPSLDGQFQEDRIVSDEHFYGNAATDLKDEKLKAEADSFFGSKTKLVWHNIVIIFALHFAALYAVLTFSFLENIWTSLWVVLMCVYVAFGITGGAHRLWSHRSYKAKLPLRIILMACFLMSGTNRLFHWVRDHRVHHKYSETDADPHNSNRGFFFSHVGWLMMKKHPDVLRSGRQIDMNDILNDPVVRFADKYFLFLKILLAFVLPTLVPVYFWNETWNRAIVSQLLIRYPFTLNSTWSVNSFAHIWGNKPYAKSISPVENALVSFVACGEGWHNYHHTFPWDYKASELGNHLLNITTVCINLFAKIGWAYDLKEPSKDLIMKVALKNGDGSHSSCQEIPYPTSKDN